MPDYRPGAPESRTRSWLIAGVVVVLSVAVGGALGWYGIPWLLG